MMSPRRGHDDVSDTSKSAQDLVQSFSDAVSGSICSARNPARWRAGYVIRDREARKASLSHITFQSQGVEIRFQSVIQ